MSNTRRNSHRYCYQKHPYINKQRISVPQTRKKNISARGKSSRLFLGTVLYLTAPSGSGTYVSLHFFPNKTLKAKLHPVKSFQSHGAKMFFVFFWGGWNFQEKYTSASTAPLSSETHVPYMYFTLHTPPNPPGSRFVTYLDLPSKTNSKGPPKPSSKNLRLTVESFSWSPGLVVFPLVGRVMFFFGEVIIVKKCQVPRSVSDPLNSIFFKHLQAAKV